jgi:predicted aspartyl protease
VLNKQTVLAASSLLLFLNGSALVGFSATGAQAPESLHSLFAAGKVFALRDSMRHKNVPVFYRGAVETSLNHIETATNYLHRVIQANPRSEDAYQAHYLLYKLYARNGLYREAFRELEAAMQERPNSKDLGGDQPLFEILAKSGDMTVVDSRPTAMHLMKDGQLPFRIHGRSDGFYFDTGANISIMSDREAAHLGLTSVAVSTKLQDSSGNGGVGFRVAVARNMVIGGLRLRNVPFLVIPDTHEPFVEFAPNQGHRGLIGLPILLAMQTIRWTPNGDFEFGFSSMPAQSQNLLFHELSPVVQVGVQKRMLDFTLDTGAIDTDLNPIFAKEFPAMISSGEKENHAITGVGGTRDYESVVLPSVPLTVGGKDVTLAPAHVSVAQGLGGTNMWAGNLGVDLLNQAHTVTIDFRAMSLTLN